MAKKTIEKIELLPSKKVLPAFCDVILAFSYIEMVILLILSFVTKLQANRFIFVGIILATVLILIITSKSFSWFECQTLTIKNNELQIIVSDKISNKNTVGGETKVTIHNVDKIKQKGKDLIIYGDITKVEMHRKKEVKSFNILEGNTPEVLEFIDKHRNS